MNINSKGWHFVLEEKSLKSRSLQGFLIVQSREAISLIFFSLKLINQSYYKPTKGLPEVWSHDCLHLNHSPHCTVRPGTPTHYSAALLYFISFHFCVCACVCPCLCVCVCVCLCIHVYTLEHTQSSPAAVLLSFHLSQQIHVSAPGNSQLSSLNSQVPSILRVGRFTENPQARVPSKLGQMKIRHKVCVTLKRNCKLCITSFFDYHAAIIQT